MVDVWKLFYDLWECFKNMTDCSKSKCFNYAFYMIIKNMSLLEPCRLLECQNLPAGALICQAALR